MGWPTLRMANWASTAGYIRSIQKRHAGGRIYAQLDDASAYLAKAQELAGTLVREAMEIPGIEIIVGMFLDPGGNRFGVIQPRHDHV